MLFTFQVSLPPCYPESIKWCPKSNNIYVICGTTVHCILNEQKRETISITTNTSTSVVNKSRTSFDPLLLQRFLTKSIISIELSKTTKTSILMNDNSGVYIYKQSNLIQNLNNPEKIFVCQCWMKDDMFAIGTNTGDVLIYKFVNEYEIKLEYEFHAHNGKITSMKFTNDNILITGGSDGLVSCWKNDQVGKKMMDLYSINDNIPVYLIETRNDIITFAKGFSIHVNLNNRILKGHSSIITGIHIIDYNTIYSTSQDGSLIKWNKNNEIEYIIQPNRQNPLWGCAPSPNNVKLAVLKVFPNTAKKGLSIDRKDKIEILMVPIILESDLLKILLKIGNGNKQII